MGELARIDIAWLAGLLEGEGSFIKPAPSDHGRPRISLVMTDLDIVKRAADMFGVAYICHEKRPGNVLWKESFRISVRGRRAVVLMKQVYSLMGYRRQRRIDEILATYVERPAAAPKLSDNAVHDIRTKRISMREFAKLYCVAKGTIQRVQQGIYYKDIK